MEESAKCVVLCSCKMHLSANQTQAIGLDTSYMINNSLLGGEERLHTLSGAKLDYHKTFWWSG
eukprot:4386868-Ditylum_brightwellii.AAC.1